MAEIISKSSFGDQGLMEIDYDPRSTSINCMKGCLIKDDVVTNTWYRKTTDGDNSDVEAIFFSRTLTLTDAVNISWDLEIGNIGTVVLGGNRTLDNLTNLFNGKKIVLYAKQDAIARSSSQEEAHWSECDRYTRIHYRWN